MKSFFQKVFDFVLRYPFAVIGTILVVVFAVIVVFIFRQEIQIGGILGWLWGKKIELDSNIKVLPPINRVDNDGKPIAAGDSDKGGWTQAPINTEIKEPWIFSNPKVIVVTHPDKGEVKIPLPDGVINKDVKQVTEVAPDIYQLTNNDKSSVDAAQLLKDLDK